MTPSGNFACGNGHVVAAATAQGYRDIDLTGHLCPVCLGQVKGHGDLIDSRILAPVQEKEAMR